MFCISNSEYAKHAIGYERKEPPMMSVASTGIPGLRSFLYGLPADRKLRAFQHYRRTTLPSLLNNLEMACSQTKLMRREELQKILSSASEPVSNEINNIFGLFWSSAILPAIVDIKSKKRVYADHAITALSKWTKWKNQTHKAFCIHRGNWTTKAVGTHDWNGAMLAPLIKAIEKDTKGWDDAIQSLSAKLSDKMGTLVADLINQLEQAAGSSKDSMKPFFDELRAKSRLLDFKCQERVEKTEKDLDDIKESLTNTKDMKNSYFVEILESTYDECSNITGPGASEARSDILKSKLSETVRGPFLLLYKMTKDAAQQAILKHVKELNQEVDEVFTDVNRSFNHSFKTDEADSPEAKELREMLRSRVPKWRNVLTDDVDHLLITCTKYAQSS
ncbi:hypothetical protein UCDDS831_g07197 [Diplodia seriata]|uniref:DUF7605 domain-containing protein n=1 Tax=Diplodia seriata TaxID=420778 RepID=A0A0G2E091_9PEZI|nr:hypothetical protein UCDDS831_g07197 [Diplodia seriata]